VVFTPWDRPLFAIENQTSSTDAHNLWDQGKKRESHLLVLEPGARGGGFVEWRLRRVPVNAATPSQPAHARYDQRAAAQMVPLLSEVLRFPTVAGNDAARVNQQAWLKKTGTALGLTVRDAGPVTEVELPGPAGAPVLGLLVHGDVQPVEEAKWTIPPFEGAARDGYVLGRGSADDKGPLVQALLAMVALRDSGLARTHTVRLLVGSDEESANLDISTYLKTHRPPAFSLVLDSAFPAVVGEKAWNALYLTTPLTERPGSKLPYEVSALEAGLSPSIVPDEARLVLRWKEGAPAWDKLTARLRKRPLPPGTRLEVEPAADKLTVIARGKSAHGGVNLEGGRNALLALAGAVEGALPAGGASDLLAAARAAGKDLYGGGFGLTERDPLWGRYSVNVATLKQVEGGHRLVINLRRTPPLTGPQLQARLEEWTKRFNARTGATLQPDGFYKDEPLSFDPGSKLVKRLLAAYTRATGSAAPPAISGGGTYAKRMPSSIAFGMWFPGAAYPGHDVDEKVPVIDLHRGTHVLIEALADLACGPPLAEPFKP
jgi:dipeptidase D